jgi:transcription antitermination factor NusG
VQGVVIMERFNPKIWYAVRTSVHGTRRKSPDGKTIMEAALAEAEIDFYLPQETKTLTHRRTKAKITRKFPLIPGYVFLANVRDWRKAQALPGIHGPVRIKGEPMAIPAWQIDRLREAEQAIDAEAKGRPGLPIGTPIRIGASVPLIGGMLGTITGETGRGTIKAMAEMLSGKITCELNLDQFEALA